MKRCKHCGDSWLPDDSDVCRACLALKKWIGDDVALARIVYNQSLLASALCGNRRRYLAILRDLENEDE
jgi:hypothetical protein